ncbi:hypothetical protein JZX87_29005 [Agrobacterium sp. Ap1]|uniref:hypothetical protein n=1 Tax=Agrobacterium sp. Ap1 TaxID=2815337 RepID=UPI001A8EC193|nr:hypothetical protein [Agrobacterium sp. Ap1]MBO0145173.1 hypothetical protein [Agrobacterium sp. Ap1]
MTCSDIDVRLDPSQDRGANAGIEKVEPLVPAVTHYDKIVDEVARAKAMPYLEQDMETVRRVARNVYADPFGVAAVLKSRSSGGR